jgi:hypothetical protein
VTVVVDCKAGLPLSAAAMVTYKIITYILNWDISYSLQKKTIKKKKMLKMCSPQKERITFLLKS